MDIDLQPDILFSQHQQKKKYKKNNFNARNKKSIAEEEDEQLYLPPIKSARQCPSVALYDRKNCSELITNGEDENIEYGFLDNADSSSNENYVMIINDEGEVLNDDYDEENNEFSTDEFTDDSLYVNDYENLRVELPLFLHQFTSLSTKSVYVQLLKLLREANVSKSHSARFISLIQSILPIPNNFPSRLDGLISALNIENLFIKRTVCLICQSNLNFDEKKCSTCGILDVKMQADIYDINIRKVLTNMLNRLSPSIEEYKQKVLNDVDVDDTNDIPFGHLYRKLLDQHGAENIISLILHLDGIGLTRSTGLKMWLFSGAFAELPSILRYRRHNMVLLSIWIGYVEPNPDLWLRSIISELVHIKKQDIYINEHLIYKLKFLSVTGDCPALRLVLNFIGHGGYHCCWYRYIRGEHIDNKRQYKYEESMVIRNSTSYSRESIMAYDNKMTIFGHKGVTILQSLLDVPLPESIIIDYLHISLLGHAKALILNLYRCITPTERTELDQKLIEQSFPHYFNRKMRKIAKFANIKATEVKNILLYGLLPNFQSYLSIEKLSHVALYVCFIRLLHGRPILGPETSDIADKLFRLFYRDHDDYFDGLQNFVLHLHTHLITVYKNYGALSNIGCFGQEDLIGKIGSNHHGTRYYGELITFYYNIDYSLHDKSSTPLPVNNQPCDLVLDSLNETGFIHEQLCDCEQAGDCFSIYRRFIINQQMYHSLLYNRRGRSTSYFVQYFNDQMSAKFGIIEFFFTIKSRRKSYAYINEYRVQQKYSNYFKDSKYFDVLRIPLDAFFFVLEDHSSGKDFVCTDSIKKHCIVFQMNNFKIVTPILAYNEHD